MVSVSFQLIPVGGFAKGKRKKKDQIHLEACDHSALVQFPFKKWSSEMIRGRQSVEKKKSASDVGE